MSIQRLVLVFIAALFAIAKNCKQSKVHKEVSKQMSDGYPYLGILFSNEKEQAVATHRMNAHNTILRKKPDLTEYTISFLL